MEEDSNALEFALTLLFALVTAVSIGFWTQPLFGEGLSRDLLRMLVSGGAGGLVAWHLWRCRKGDQASEG